jgi:hypothetical protein
VKRRDVVCIALPVALVNIAVRSGVFIADRFQ